MTNLKEPFAQDGTESAVLFNFSSFISRVLSSLLDFMIHAYKIFLSPYLGGNCRYSPSCSNYCAECFEKHGFGRALWLSLRRLSSCHPFSHGGYDPVPTSDFETSRFVEEGLASKGTSQ